MQVRVIRSLTFLMGLSKPTINYTIFTIVKVNTIHTSMPYLCSCSNFRKFQLQNGFFIYLQYNILLLQNYYYSMDECEQTYSQEESQLPPPATQEFELEECPHCHRHFFVGKLHYHLKLCTPQTPMLLSPLKASKTKQVTGRLRDPVLNQMGKKCPKCLAKLPSFLYNKHKANCCLEPSSCPKPVDEPTNKRSSTTGANFKGHSQREEVNLPQITRTPQPGGKARMPLNEAYKVRIPEELRCFKRAEEIKTVECQSCGRTFSKEASLRHIPVCSALREKAEKSIALKRKPKSTNSSAMGGSIRRKKPRSPHRREKSLQVQHGNQVDFLPNPENM